MAALNDKQTGSICATAAQDYWCRRAPGWVVSEHMFDATNPTNESCAVMFKAPTNGFRVADWWVTCEQIDGHASTPTLVMKVGLLNNSTTPTGLFKEWEQSSALLGRGKRDGTDGLTGTVINPITLSRNLDGLCAHGYNYPGYDIGVHISNVAATASQNYKKLIMGVLFAPW